MLSLKKILPNSSLWPGSVHNHDLHFIQINRTRNWQGVTVCGSNALDTEPRDPGNPDCMVAEQIN